MKKRALSWLLALTMLLTLAPQTLPVWASATGEKSNTATQTESKLSANTYSALGLSRSIKPSDEGLDQGKQPYGDAVEGNTIATNVINELYVNFNGSIHYGWSILDNIPMEYRDNGQINNDWTSSDNFYGAMGYWRPNQQQVNYKSGKESNGALFAENGSKTGGEHKRINNSSDYINSANKHIVYQYSKSEAFSPNTGKDNYVAELVVSDDGMVSLYIYQVEGGNKRYVRGTNIGKNPYVGDANDKTNIIWNWEYDAMFDIAAGDMDGDGYDEIAVYTATSDKQAVHLYKYTGGALTEITTKPVTVPSNSNATGQNKKLGTAVVTLAFGDLNADDKDELVIAENMPYWSRNIEKGKVGIYALENKKLEPKHDLSLQHYNETAQNDHYAIRYVNVATGDIDGDNKDELIAAGYYSEWNNNAKCSRDNIWYNIVKVEDGQYKNSGWKSTEFKTQDLLGRVVDNEKQLIPPVSLTCAATQGVGYAEQVFLGGCLYTVKNDNSLEYLTRISTNREYKKDDGKKANKEEIFVVNVVAGNFNGNRNGQEQIVYAFGMKHDDSDRYWYDIGYINKKNPGNSDSDYWYGQEQVMNFESSYNRDSNKRRASLYLSLAAVDCDNDSTLMRYKGQEVTWTKPEVLTILQSAPYFQDLEDTRGYINQGQTGYGKGQGSGSSATAGTSLSVGTYVSFEQDFSVFGVKIASIQAEAQTKHSFNYGYEHNQTVETEVNYSGSAGDDYAVVYAVPYMEYQYETWVPGYKLPTGDKYTEYLNQYLEGKLGKDAWAKADQGAERSKAQKELGITPGMEVKGSWQPCTVSVPMTPRTVMLSVDDYDDIANVTEGLQPIRGNILNSTPGDPTTYDVENSRKDFNKIGTLQTVTKAQGSNISVTQTATTEEEHSFEYEYEFEAKVGAGAGGLTVGVLAGFGANAGGGISTSTSKSYSATVDNLPSDADGYALSWQFGWRKAKLNNNDVLVLEYQQKDTKAKPSPPKNLRVESVTSNSVTLTWDPVTGAGAYKIYQVNNATGKLFAMKTLAGTATSWTNTALSSNTNYTYVAKTITQSGEESITSVSVNASTLEANKDNFKILEQPKEQEEAAAGSSVNMSVSAEYRNEDGSLNDLHYQWETYNTEATRTEQKGWQPIQGAEQPTYSVTVTEKNDGKRYRCQVYSSASLYLYSKEVTLKVGRSATTTSLTSDSFNQTVKSAYLKETQEPVTEIVDNREVPVYEQKQVTEKINETTYDVYLVNETEVYFAKTENGKYYTKSGTSLTEVGPAKTNFIMYNDMKILMDNLIKSAFDNGEQVTYTETNEDGETDATGLKTYTATEKFIYSYTDNGTTKTLTLFFAKTTGDSNGIYLVKQSGDTGKTYLPVEVETEETIKVGETEVEISSLQAKMEDDKNKPVTRTVQTKEAGDPVELKATISGTKPTGTVTFKIVNTTGDGGAMIDVEVGANGTATTTWTPTTSGIYVVTAIYSGSDTFKESQSDSYTINVVTPGEKKLVVSGENMTYGESQTLKATLFEGGSASGTTNVSTTDVSNNVTYTVMRDGTDVTNQNELSSSGRFTPKQAGTYTITASYTDPSAAGQAEGESGKANNVITSTKVITVNRKTVTVSPEVDENTKEIKCEPKGAVTQEDTELIKSKITILCDGKKENAAAGVYPITVTYESDDTINSKYLIVCDNSKTYEIKDDVIKVTNDTKINSNGKVTLSYIYKDHTYEVVSQNGGVGYIPKEAKLTATAQPNVGYRVEKWLVDNKIVYMTDGHTPNTENTITVRETTDTDVTVEAAFTQIYYPVNFGFQTAGDGTITAKYVNDNGGTGTVFNSGSQLSPLQKIQLTAKPENGQVISGWQIKTGNDVKTVTNKDGTNYTGNTYTLSAISGETEVTVLTEFSTEYPVTVKLVDEKGDPLGTANATVSFDPTSEKTAESEGTYTYPGQKHQDLTISLNIQDSLIVDSWTAGEGQTMPGTLSANKKKLTISNLQGDAGKLDLTVKCVTPNSYPVTVTKTGEGDIGIYKNLESTALTLDSSSSVQVRQASSLRVVLKPTSGWQVLNVLVNDEPVTLENVIDNLENKAFTIDSVDGATNIKVTFVKKPVVRFSVTPEGETAHGTVTANGMEFSGGTVPYGYKNNIVFTAKPKHGYEVDSWTVTGVTDPQGTPVANSDNQTYTYTPGAETGITSDLTVTVSFKALPKATVEFSVVDKNNETDGGFDGTIQATVARNGQSAPSEKVTSGTLTNVYRDSKVTFAAEPADGYKVTKWLLNDEEQTTSPVLDIGEEDNDTTKKVQVQFEKISNKITYAIDPTSDTGHGATLDVTFLANTGTSSEAVKSGNSVTTSGVLTATVNDLNDGYEIESWTLNGTPYTSTNGKLTCNVSETQGADIKVKIVRKSYQIIFSATEGGTITAKVDETALTSPASVKGDKQVTFTASTPETGYEFVGWKVDEKTVQSNSDPYVLTVSKNTSVQACYALTTAKYQVTYGIIQTSGKDNGTLAASGLDSNGKANAGSNITFTATPAAGYQVKQWYNAATSGTEIGVAENTTYEIKNLTANESVYVQFEPIPTYNITVNVSGQGSVTATVNGNPATITNNMLEVKRHDSVVLTAEPEVGHHLKEWTGGTASQENPLTLTLSDVTAPHAITANFEVNQGVPFKTECGTGGSLEAKAGYENNLQPINADTGIQVDKGKKIVLTAKPDNGKAVVWTVNNQPTNELSNTYTIDAISENTTVKANFVTLELCTIPTDMSNDTYSISSVTKYPADYGDANQIRKGGTLSFKLTPKKPVMGLQGLPDNAQVVYNSDGSYTVTVTNVSSSIAVTATAYQVEAKGLNDYEVPPSLKDPNLNSITDIETKLKTTLTGRKDGIVFYDIVLKASDGTPVTTFPANGVYVTIPYPDGTNKQDTFRIVHMLTVDMNGKKAGEVEEITPITKGENGISFHVTSLSPFAIGWTKYVAPTPGGGGGGGGSAVSTYTLTFDTNGGSVIDKITKDSGTTIDLAAYKPTRAGYTFAGWFSDKALTKAVTSVKLTANTTVYAKWTQSGGTAQNPFVDVKEGAYYYDAVLWAVEQKITSGTSATTFSPDASCTRAQMVTFLWRAAGSPKVENGKNPFVDVKADAYYYDAVLWAVEKGVTSGTSATTFSPDATVTRGQTVTFLYRNAGSPEVSGTMPFTDVEADAYYAKAVQWAVQQKITTGTSETTFSPMSDCTRGQIVTFLYRAK